MSQNLEFVIFGLTLLGVAIFHRRSLSAALAGLIATVLYKLVFPSFEEGAGLLAWQSISARVGHFTKFDVVARRLCGPRASR
jgi:hypothetical protein